MRTPEYDAIIIGGSAAGLSTAQSLGRARRRTIVLDDGSARNRFASHMHNVLGHDGLPPAELAARGREEAARYGVEFRAATVASVRDLTGSAPAQPGAASLEVLLTDGSTLAARAVVVASGVTDELAPIPGLAERWGDTVLHCPYCHGWEVRDRPIGVIPSSPAGLHLARLVRQWSADLVVFAAGLGELDDDARGDFAARGVELVESAVVAVEDGDAAGVTVRTADGGAFELAAVFTNSAMSPRADMLEPLGLEFTEGLMGTSIAVDAMGLTSHPRVWAAGNVANPAASVPMCAAAGTLAGAAANHALVEDDYAAAPPPCRFCATRACYR
ncbi:NAD(P)/FAD-dependent oxidoreductase [Leucobacter luti]|uniref:NAD(P)/FAD-dependent oxidoreductase n=1 Tax=Leucobacter luti TaxID=340320 RepID=UPI003D01E443